MKEWMTESRKSESNILAIPNTTRDSVHENSQENTSSSPVQSPLPRLDLPQAAFDFSEDREETAESLCTDEPALETPETNGQNTPYRPGSCKSTRKNFGKPASSFSDFYMCNNMCGKWYLQVIYFLLLFPYFHKLSFNYFDI